MHVFTFKDKEYTYLWAHEVTIKDLPVGKKYKQSKYIDIGSGFDIETSRIGTEKLSTMYVWQMSLNELTVLGRTWEELREFLDMISKYYKLGPKKKLLCFIHNMSFEWSFIKLQLKWGIEKKRPSVFATAPREVIKATTDNYIEFRDSAMLTQMSLDKLAKNYELPVQKLKEDTNFDYSLPRHYMTTLTEAEIAYCINDVQILQHFYHKYIKKEFIANQHKVPLTSTGIVREDLRRSFKRQPKRWKVKYLRRIKQAFPDFNTYTAIIRWLYRGGYVHSNSILTDEVFDTFTLGLKLGAKDIKSSYPAQFLHFKYGWRFNEKPVEWFKKYADSYKFNNEYAWFGTFDFYNIDSRSTHSIESKSKLIIVEGGEFDNGRLIKASHIRVMLTDIDFLNYKDFYKWESVECINFYTSTKEELPEFFKDIILKYFYYKESPKYSSDKYLRGINKRKLNSTYGMTVSGLLHETLVFDNKSGMMRPVDVQRSYEEIIEKELLLPWWGIECTAYARRAILQQIKRCEYYTCVYSDTDSIKQVNAAAYKWVFDTYNDKMRRINKTMYVGEYDRSLYTELGCFEDETEDTGRITRFKALGAKRYVYTTMKDGKREDHAVIAGMRKGSLQAHCKATGEDIYTAFRSGLRLNTDESMKLTTSYEDSYWEREFTDYQGQTVTVSEKSCVTLYEIPFKMTLAEDYEELIERVKRLNERRLVPRRY